MALELGFKKCQIGKSLAYVLPSNSAQKKEMQTNLPHQPRKPSCNQARENLMILLMVNSLEGPHGKKVCGPKLKQGEAIERKKALSKTKLEV